VGCSRADFFDFKVFSHGEFVGAVAETLAAKSVTRVLYPDDSTGLGQRLRFVQEYFLVACSLRDLIPSFSAQQCGLEPACGQDSHPTQRHSSFDGGARTHADLAG